MVGELGIAGGLCMHLRGMQRLQSHMLGKAVFAPKDRNRVYDISFSVMRRDRQLWTVNRPV